MNVDPLAGLRQWAIALELGGQEYVIPPRPAADWVVAILATDEIFPVLSLLEPDDYQEVKHRALLLQEIDLEEISEASKEALAQQSGWPWWTVQLLIQSAAAEWRLIFGEMIKRGLDPRSLPLGAWLNGLYAMATERLDANERAAFDMRIDRPPAGAGISPEQRDEWAAEAFAAAIQEAGGSLTLPPGTG